MLEWGSIEQQSMRGVRRNHPPPIIPIYYRPYHNAFQDLFWSRNNALGKVGGIPFDTILSYAETVGVTDLELFIDIIQYMDKCYLDKINDKGKS